MQTNFSNCEACSAIWLAMRAHYTWLYCLEKENIMKRRVIAIVMICIMTFVLMSCSKEKTEGGATPSVTPSANGRFTPGTYEGKATGYGGEVKATVVLTNDRIESVVVYGPKETENIGSIAIRDLPLEIEEQQSVQVDVVSGATTTSKAIIEAVTAALTSAGVDVSNLKPVVPQPTKEVALPEENMAVDVCVIGAGGAGMTAAIEAKAAGLNVVILEKMSMAGGNTVKATGGMNAAETPLQKSLGISDTVDSFVEDTMKGGNYVNNETLVRTMAQNSADAVAWLESIGAPLSKLTFSGGATFKRMHAPEGGAAIGNYIVNTFLNNIESNGIKIIYNTKATEILMEDGKVSGVMAKGKEKNYKIACEAVILATGGFGANEAMVEEYDQSLRGFKTTNAPGATGDGILMAQAVGANVIDMEQIQTHPTVEQETSIMVTESVRGQGAILVNQKGERFYNELSTRNLVSNAIMKQEGGYAYLIFDQQLRESLNAVESYIEADIVDEEDNLGELADDIDVNPDTLIATVAEWNKTITDKGQDLFNRTTGMDTTISKAPYYAIKVAPAIHHTMGGVEINTKTEVISTDGKAIPGLFAAGEVTGGVHGANRIGGNAVCDIVVFGRIAAKSAAEYITTH